MPVRIQGRLLAEVGAMLGLCLAAVGCQTAAPHNNLAAAPPAAGASPAPAGPLLTRLRNLTGGDANAETPPWRGGQTVSVVQPPANNRGVEGTEPVGAWQPIRRTGGEEIQAQPVTPAVHSSGVPAELAPEATRLPTVLATAGPEPAADEPPAVLPRPTPLPPEGAPPVVVVDPAHAALAPPAPAHAPREFDKRSFPPYVIEPPDILLIQSSQKLLDQPISGQHLVRMDGSVSLGIYGSVYVAGLTIEEARQAIAAQLDKRIKEFDIKSLGVDVIAYNSKVYYVVTDGGGYGEQVYRIPATGNETVLDALAQINGLPAVASKKHIWVARATPGDGVHPQVMPVDWNGIVRRGSGETNYQIFPGDRIYVCSDPWIQKDTWLAKRLAPLQNLLGTVLLGSSTYNSISNRTAGNGTGTGAIR